MSLQLKVPSLRPNCRIAILGIVAMALFATACGAIIQAPDDWLEAETPPGNALTVFYSSEPDFYEDIAFTAKITVVVEEAFNLTLEEYVASSEQLIPSLVPDSTVTSTSSSEIDGKPAYFVDVRFLQEPLALRSRQMCVHLDDKFYVITAMALEAHWEKYADAFERSLLSFNP